MEKKKRQNVLKIKYHRSACHTDLLWYFLIYSWPILDAHVLKNGNSLWRHWHPGVDRIWTRQKSVLKWEDHWNVHIPSTSGWCYIYMRLYVYLCIAMYLYIYIYIFIFIYLFILFIYLWFIHLFICICIYMCVCVCTHLDIRRLSPTNVPIQGWPCWPRPNFPMIKPLKTVHVYWLNHHLCWLKLPCLRFKSSFYRVKPVFLLETTSFLLKPPYVSIFLGKTGWPSQQKPLPGGLDQLLSTRSGLTSAHPRHLSPSELVWKIGHQSCQLKTATAWGLPGGQTQEGGP